MGTFWDYGLIWWGSGRRQSRFSMERTCHCAVRRQSKRLLGGPKMADGCELINLKVINCCITTGGYFMVKHWSSLVVVSPAPEFESQHFFRRATFAVAPSKLLSWAKSESPEIIHPGLMMVTMVNTMAHGVDSVEWFVSWWLSWWLIIVWTIECWW